MVITSNGVSWCCVSILKCLITKDHTVFHTKLWYWKSNFTESNIPTHLTKLSITDVQVFFLDGSTLVKTISLDYNWWLWNRSPKKNISITASQMFFFIVKCRYQLKAFAVNRIVGFPYLYFGIKRGDHTKVLRRKHDELSNFTQLWKCNVPMDKKKMTIKILINGFL